MSAAVVLAGALRDGVAEPHSDAAPVRASKPSRRRVA